MFYEKCVEIHSESARFVEAMLVLYKVTKEGQLITLDQKTIKYNSKYQPSVDNQMRLKVSKNKQWVYLVMQGHGVKPNHKTPKEQEPAGRKSKKPVVVDDSSESSDSCEEDAKYCKLHLQAWEVKSRSLEDVSSKIHSRMHDKLYFQNKGTLVNLLIFGHDNEYML